MAAATAKNKSPKSKKTRPDPPPPSATQPADEALRRECRDDFDRFTREFFPEYCRIPTFSELHRHLFARRLAKVAAPLPDRRGELDVVLAPRGAAKSTFVSLIFPIHGLLYELERFIVLISATRHQAGLRLGAIRAALLQNTRLREAFPDKLAEKPRESNSESLVVAGVRIMAASPGTELRGISHGAWRPTWIVLDDVERSDRVRSARRRDEMADWFAEIVDNLGDTFTNVDLIGTLLHRDALPARLEKRPTAACSLYRSIQREADATPLWEQWRAIFNDLTNSRRTRDAFEFYRRNGEAMERGAEVLWREKESYYDLQVLRETSGRAAFDREKQNDPWGDDTAAFAAIRLRRFRIEDGRLACDPMCAESSPGPRRQGEPPVLGDLRIFGFLDPALGGPRGDYAAIATVGRDGNKQYYLLDVWLERATPTEQVRRIFELDERWHYELFGVESNHFQKLLLEHIEAERERRRGVGLPARCNVAGVAHKADKHTRIMNLEPYLSNGSLMLHADLGEKFMKQLLDYPNGKHDDGPDALAAALKLALDSGESSSAKMKTAPRRTRTNFEI